MSNIAYLEFRLSGGSANTNPELSLGGQISNQILADQAVVAPTNITGVTILYATNNVVGNGTLTFTSSNQSITWAGAGRTAGPPVVINANGRYSLRDSGGGSAGDGVIHINVVFASLPGTNQSDTLAVTSPKNMLFDDLSKEQTFQGHVEYRGWYIRWTHPTSPCIGGLAYIKTQPAGQSVIAIGKDPAGVGDGITSGVATTIGSSTIAPAGVTFSSPTGTSNAITWGTLQPNQCILLWERRTTPANVEQTTDPDGVTIEVQVRV